MKLHKNLVIFLGILILSQAIAGSVRTAIFLGLILWAARGTVFALQSISLATIVIYTNSNIAAENTIISKLKWILLAITVIRILIERIKEHDRIPKVVLSFFAFLFAIATTGYAASANYAVTIFKILVFVVGVFIPIFGFSLKVREYDWASWFYTLFFTVLILSLPLMFFRVGYDITGRYFQGILAHPQAFGVFVAPFAAWMLIEYLSNSGRRDFIIIFLLTLLGLFITKARTSILAFSLGVAATFIAGLRNQETGRIFTRKKFVFIFGAILAVSIVSLLYAQDRITSGMMGYMVKGYKVKSEANMDEVWRGIQYSRGEQIEQSIENFLWNPAIGVGFGMTDRFGIKIKDRGEFLDIPLSTDSEMGFIFLAVLGQTGIIGSILFIVFLYQLYRPILTYGHPGWIALSTTAFFVNFGETVLFSSGGLGAFIWLLISFAYLESIRKKNEDKVLAKYHQSSSG